MKNKNKWLNESEGIKPPPIPNGHMIWLVRTLSDGDVYIITSLEDDRRKYFLWALSKGGDKWVKLGTNDNPVVLEDKLIESDTGEYKGEERRIGDDRAYER